MKSTGIVRKLDKLGRVVLPIELRRELKLDEEPLEIYVDDEMVILKKYTPACIFCGNAKDTVMFRDKKICSECMAKLRG